MRQIVFISDTAISKDGKTECRICQYATEFFQRCLWSSSGDWARIFCDIKLEISDKAALEYQLGYAPKNDELKQHLLGCGFSIDEIKASSLFNQTENGDICQVFFDKLMVPIRDEQGNYIAFGAISLDIDKATEFTLSSFDKSEELYGLIDAQGSETIILCDSFFQVIFLADRGIYNAVAFLGKELTKEQAEKLKKYTRKILLSFRSDNAKALAHALYILESVGMEVSILG